MLVRVFWILENEMNIVIPLALHANDSADHLIDLEFLATHTVIRCRTAMSRDRVERLDRRADRDIKLNCAGLRIAKTLHVRTVDGTTRHHAGKCN